MGKIIRPTVLKMMIYLKARFNFRITIEYLNKELSVKVHRSCSYATLKVDNLYLKVMYIGAQSTKKSIEANTKRTR